MKQSPKHTPENIEIWNTMIGKKVWKNPRTNTQTSPKPFKSGFKVNTVKGIVKHDRTDNLAFVFEEDESQVECWRCSIAPSGRTDTMDQLVSVVNNSDKFLLENVMKSIDEALSKT